MQNCQLPPELTEDELSALIDGDAEAQTQDHIQRCPYCAKRLKNARKIEVGLSKALYRRNCPSSLELGQYDLDLLDSPQRKTYIDNHLKTCVLCRRDLRFLSADDDVAARPSSGGKAGVVLPYIARIDTSLSRVRGAEIQRIVATAETTTIRLSFETVSDEWIEMTVQLISPDVAWRGGRVEVKRDKSQSEDAVAVCYLDEHIRAICKVPKTSLWILFTAEDGTLIELSDVDLNL